MTGKDIAIASIAGKHQPSPRVGRTNASDDAYNQRSSSRDSSLRRPHRETQHACPARRELPQPWHTAKAIKCSMHGAHSLRTAARPRSVRAREALRRAAGRHPATNRRCSGADSTPLSKTNTWHLVIYIAKMMVAGCYLMANFPVRLERTQPQHDIVIFAELIPVPASQLSVKTRPHGGHQAAGSCLPPQQQIPAFAVLPFEHRNEHERLPPSQRLPSLAPPHSHAPTPCRRRSQPPAGQHRPQPPCGARPTFPVKNPLADVPNGQKSRWRRGAGRGF
jgi:hypothetical protein